MSSKKDENKREVVLRDLLNLGNIPTPLDTGDEAASHQEILHYLHTLTQHISFTELSEK